MKYQPLFDLLRADASDIKIADELMSLANGPANDIQTHRIASALRLDLERYGKELANAGELELSVPRSLQRKIGKLKTLVNGDSGHDETADAFLAQIDRWAAPI